MLQFLTIHQLDIMLAFKPVGYQLKTIDRKTLRENIANFFDSQKASI